jgi:hypothetical protein
MNKELILNDIVKDIYFDEKYTELYTSYGDKVKTFVYQEGDLHFKNTFIKSKIEKVKGITIEEELFDASTQYGYGGIQCNTSDQAFLRNAFKAFKSFCEDENIIANFYRFHPFLDAMPFKENISFFHENSRVVYIDLTLSKEDRWKNYSSSTRNILRKCEKNLSFELSNNLDNFMELYYDTMKKNNASNFYYFDKEYFQKLNELDDVNLYTVKFDGEVISSGFFFLSGDYAHYHLSSNNSAFYKLNGNYSLLENVAAAAKEKGCKYFLLGGGRTASIDDSLLKFKMKFTKNSLPFYIAGDVYNRQKYDQLNQLWIKENNGEDKAYFLKYRLP